MMSLQFRQTRRTNPDVSRAGPPSHSRRHLLLLILPLLALSHPLFAQEGTPTDPVNTPVDASAQPEEPAESASQPTESLSEPAEPTEPKNPKNYYGLWVLLPAIISIVLAIFTRQVVPALVVGIITGAYMLLPCLPKGDPLADGNTIIGGVRLAAERYVIGSIHEAPDQNFAHIKIMIFTLVIGFTVGVMGRNGGTAGMVHLVAGKTNSPRRGALTAWLAGLVVFFDDYANTMIVGPTMRSVFDKLKLSRAKLAYIVDSTAAPVASLALIGTWIGAEIGFIDQGLQQVAQADAPAFLLDNQGEMVTGMYAFMHSIPYRFYPILALVMAFLIAATRRDFGPMKRAEARALAGQDEHPYDAASVGSREKEPTPRWWLGLVPVLVLVGATMIVLYVSGHGGNAAAGALQPEMPLWQKVFEIINRADPNLAIFYGAMLSAFAAVLLTLVARATSIRSAVDAGLDGMARMFPAIVILILAWSLSAVEQDLMLGEVVKERLMASNFSVHWMPVAIFLAAGGISFATGTSWGTMGILCPAVVTITAGLVAGMEPDRAATLFHASIGSVLAGAIFGDHCSPISDTTVLSSIASGCRHEEHVWTQLPYALVTALVAIGLGDVMCGVYGQPWYYGLGAGAFLLFMIVLVVGRRAKPAVPVYTAMP